MQKIQDWKQSLNNGEIDSQLRKLLVIPQAEVIPQSVYERFLNILDNFVKIFSGNNVTEDSEVGFFSAPGRTELIGNHTDHQRGNVIAAAVNMDVWACANPNQDNTIRFKSEGWDLIEISLDDLTVKEAEKETTAALLRGVAAGYAQKGYEPKGINIFCQSNVLPGSGLSSSAAIEVLIAVILNHFWAADQEDAVTWAKFGQYAENKYFGKPSGLMDQMASAVGSAVHIDFYDPNNVQIESFDLDLEKEQYALCIIDSGADHADLTDAYASIPVEMKTVAEYFNKDVLSEVPEAEFFDHLKTIRQEVGDRAILRAIHYYQENKRVLNAVEKYKSDDFAAFLKEIQSSGNSSWTQLQNISVEGAIKHQEMAVALATAGEILNGEGAYRVHGGGFAGTIQAFVPLSILDKFKTKIENVLGKDSCHILQIRNVGGYVFKS
ncbi:MAG: galactokinase [Clostridiaceae bacterium]|nr:galactokinase [Clostridiaceae bacterium]